MLNLNALKNILAVFTFCNLFWVLLVVHMLKFCFSQRASNQFRHFSNKNHIQFHLPLQPLPLVHFYRTEMPVKVCYKICMARTTHQRPFTFGSWREKYEHLPLRTKELLLFCARAGKKFMVNNSNVLRTFESSVCGFFVSFVGSFLLWQAKLKGKVWPGCLWPGNSAPSVTLISRNCSLFI